MQPSHRSILRVAIAAFVCLGPATMETQAEDWNTHAEKLAQKIVAHMGSRKTATLAVKNLSSLADGDVAQVRRALRSELLRQGMRLVGKTRAAAAIQVTLSENFEGFLWVAEVRHDNTQDITMISVPRPEADTFLPKSETLVIRKSLVFKQEQPILDLAWLESRGQPVPRLLVLSPEGISLYSKQSPGWRLEQTTPLARARPWPRDPRGRLRVHADGSFDVFLPATKCVGATDAALAAECRASKEPWPLDSGGPEGAHAYFASDRNFFDGRLTIEGGQELKAPPFFSAAPIPEKGRTSWLLGGADGRARLFDRKPEPIATFEGWGNDLVALKTGCGGGWQVLATRTGDLTQTDAIQAFEIHERNAVAVSSPMEFPGPLTALWPASNGSTAMAIAHDLKTGSYEAFTLSVSCAD